MRAPVSRDGRQTLSREWWPVVLVPGIMGSRIERADGSDRIWDPDRTVFMLWLMMQSPDTLTTIYNPTLTPGRTMGTVYDMDNALVEEDSPEMSIDIDRNDRNWGSVSWTHYGDGAVGIQQEIAPEGGVVWCFGYDWRRSNLENGRLLKEFVDNVVRPTSPYKPIMVTHSMGGLVTRAACRVHGMESMISGVIHTMMPTHGAAEAYGSMKHGVMDFPFRYLVGRTQLEIACVTSGAAGFFQLMPSGLYPSPTWVQIDRRFDSFCNPPGPYPMSNPYAMYREQNGLVGLAHHATFNHGWVDVGSNRYVRNGPRALRYMMGNVDEAERYHAREVRDYCHPRTWLIAGTDCETVTWSELVFEREEYAERYELPTVRGDLHHSQEGDATVPLVSARVLENHPNCRGGFIVSGFVHAESTNEPMVIHAIVDLIRGARAEELQRW
jgi:hypothetical protein